MWLKERMYTCICLCLLASKAAYTKLLTGTLQAEYNLLFINPKIITEVPYFRVKRRTCLSTTFDAKICLRSIQRRYEETC